MVPRVFLTGTKGFLLHYIAGGWVVQMDVTRCPKCKKRLMAMTDRTGKTEMLCVRCDKLDPMKVDIAKWADSSLAQPAASPIR